MLNPVVFVVCMVATRGMTQDVIFSPYVLQERINFLFQEHSITIYKKNKLNYEKKTQTT